MALHIALMTVVIIAMAGLGSEITYLFAKHRQMQVVADAAALSAAAASLHSTNVSAPSVETLAVAAQLGFLHGANGVVVTMNNPPTSGPHATSARAYEVILSQPQTLGLVGVVHSTLFPVSTRAVARIDYKLSVPLCMISLDRTASQAILLHNNVVVTSAGCGIASNSDSPSGMYFKPNAIINGPISAVGGWVAENNVQLNNPYQVYHADVTEDPYADVVLPAAPACTTQSIDAHANGVTYNFTPGHFCDGWGFTNQSNNVTINLASGVYYIDKAFSLQNGAVLNGTNVTLVINGNYRVDLKNNYTINITAPTGGATAGIAIMGLDTNKNLVQDFGNNYNINVQGAIYFPNQVIQFSNNEQTASVCTQLIGRIIELTNNVTLNSQCENTGVTQIFVQQGWLVE